MPSNSMAARFYHHPEKRSDGLFYDVVFVELRIKGDRNTTFSRKKVDQDEDDFPRSWRAFKQSSPDSAGGTPISALPFISQADQMNLRAMKVATVEQMVALPDATVNKLHDGFKTRARARAYLAALELDVSEEPESSGPFADEEQDDWVSTQDDEPEPQPKVRNRGRPRRVTA